MASSFLSKLKWDKSITSSWSLATESLYFFSSTLSVVFFLLSTSIMSLALTYINNANSIENTNRYIKILCFILSIKGLSLNYHMPKIHYLAMFSQHLHEIPNYNLCVLDKLFRG